MDPTALLRHLQDVSADLDAGRLPRRPAFLAPAGVAVLAGLIAGCEKGVSLYGVADTATEEICDNGADDDDDGLVDCDDADCSCDTAYAVPFEDCANGEDDDGDGLVDCDDAEDCDSDPACTDVPAYGVPFTED